MLMVCERCGAPLDVPPHATMARCAHCGVQVRLREPAPHTTAAPHPASPSASPKALLLILGIVAAGMVGAGAVVFQLIVAAPATAPRIPVAPRAAAASLPSEPTGPTHFSANPRTCLLDANGDGVHDLLGLGGKAGGSDLLLVDGASGAVLWNGGSQPAQTQMACLSRDWFVLVESNFQAQFFNARNLGASVRVLLRDKLSEHGMGDGCARIRTDDDSVQGIALPTGTAVTCQAKLQRYYHDEPGNLGLTDSKSQITRGKRSYALQKVGSSRVDLQACKLEYSIVSPK